jgi:UDP-N-acetylglucosamine transferase subunit ALG13
MTLTQVISKAEKGNVLVAESLNGQYLFSKNGKKGSAWLDNGVFDLAQKIHSDEDSSWAKNMNDLFKYLSK